MKKLLSLVAMFLVFAMMLASCGSGSKEQQQPDSGNTDPAPDSGRKGSLCRRNAGL